MPRHVRPRHAEPVLSNGRIATFAAFGFVSADLLRTGTYGLDALFILSGVFELAVWTHDPRKEVGDFSDPVGLRMYDHDMRDQCFPTGATPGS